MAVRVRISDFLTEIQKGKGSSLVRRTLGAPLGWISPDASLPILSGKLKGAKWIAGSGHHVYLYWSGLYELQKQTRFFESVNGSRVVYDIGAHVGFYSLLAARAVAPSGIVHSFEPLPRNLKYLHRHVVLNNAHNVVIHEDAVSDFDGELSFREGSGSYTGRLDPTGGIPVHSRSIDSLVSTGEIPPPDVVKIDIEGGEVSAIRGASEVLNNYQPTIFLATHGTEAHNECIKMLQRANYKLSSISGSNILDSDEIIAIPSERASFSVQECDGN